jgi:hypothetical protein
VCPAALQSHIRELNAVLRGHLFMGLMHRTTAAQLAGEGEAVQAAVRPLHAALLGLAREPSELAALASRLVGSGCKWHSALSHHAILTLSTHAGM